MNTNQLVLPLLAAITLSSIADAQAPQFFQAGQVVTAGNSYLGVLSASGASSTSFGAPIGIANILWDPNEPDSFVCSSTVGGATNGQLIRIEFTSATSTVSSVVATTGQFASPVAMTWDASGSEIVLLSSYYQLHRVDVDTGIATAITTGTQPWSNKSTCLAVSPTTGDLYVGTNDGRVFRLASGNGNAQLVQSGLGSLVELLVDGPSQQLVFVTGGSAGRVDLQFSSAPQYYFGTLGTPSSPGTIRSASFDHNGDILLSEYYATHVVPNVATIPPGGIAATANGSLTYPNGNGYSRGCTVVGGTTEPFRLRAEAVAPLGAYFEVDNTPTGTGFGFLLMSASTLLPVDTGPFFGLQPDALTFVLFNLTPTPGNPLAWSGAADPLPLSIPTLGMAPFFGQTWDVVGVAFGNDLSYLGRTNMRRVTWN